VWDGPSTRRPIRHDIIRRMSSVTSEVKPVVSAAHDRILFIDWLRILSVLGVFLFHNARFFDEFSDWHVKNATTGLGPSMFVGFMDQWIMPIFFVLAGASTYYSSKFRSIGEFTGERVLRLVVPYIFGVFVIVVPQAYFERISHSQLTGTSFLQFYPSYVSSIPFFHWYHLWFLAFLFAFSIITLPIFFIKDKAGNSLAARSMHVVNKPWSLALILILPLAIANIFLYPGGFWGNRDTGGWNIIAYGLFFIAGYLIVSNQRIMDIIRSLQKSPIVLVTGIAAMVSLIVVFMPELSNPAAHYGSPSFIASQIVQSIDTWWLIISFFGLAGRYLNKRNRFLTYGSEAVLPFYVLHQTVIIVIGYFVVQWSIGITPKYFIIASTSFIVIMAIYELLVRRINVLRILFGMRPKKRAKAIAIVT
jgi:glucan biosynthesis protein C